MVHENSLKNLKYKDPVPVEWSGEWWESQKALADHVKCSTGRVNANLKSGHRLRGYIVTLERKLCHQ